jgi:hypothetical protein
LACIYMTIALMGMSTRAKKIYALNNNNGHRNP